MSLRWLKVHFPQDRNGVEMRYIKTIQLKQVRLRLTEHVYGWYGIRSPMPIKYGFWYHWPFNCICLEYMWHWKQVIWGIFLADSKPLKSMVSVWPPSHDYWCSSRLIQWSPPLNHLFKWSVLIFLKLICMLMTLYFILDL